MRLGHSSPSNRLETVATRGKVRRMLCDGLHVELQLPPPRGRVAGMRSRRMHAAILGQVV